jgi:hypothetical protein
MTSTTTATTATTATTSESIYSISATGCMEVLQVQTGQELCWFYSEVMECEYFTLDRQHRIEVAGVPGDCMLMLLVYEEGLHHCSVVNTREACVD